MPIQYFVDIFNLFFHITHMIIGNSLCNSCIHRCSAGQPATNNNNTFSSVSTVSSVSSAVSSCWVFMWNWYGNQWNWELAVCLIAPVQYAITSPMYHRSLMQAATLQRNAAAIKTEIIKWNKRKKKKKTCKPFISFFQISIHGCIFAMLSYMIRIAQCCLEDWQVHNAYYILC